LFELRKEVLDEVSGFVNVAIVAAVDRSGRFGGYDGCFACVAKHVDDPFVGIVGLVGEQHIRGHGREKVVGADEVVRLAARETEADRIAKGIDQGVDFGAQSSSGATDGLVFAFFFWAPALC